MQTKLLAIAIVAVASLAACTTRPIVVDTPGPGSTVLQVPVPATANMALTDRVRAALTAGMGTDAAGITVRAEDSTVYLTGRVATTALREKAHSIAHGTAGVSRVVYDGLVVN